MNLLELNIDEADVEILTEVLESYISDLSMKVIFPISRWR